MFIYQLRSPHTLMTYVGSTSNPLPVRYAMHVIKEHYWKTTGNTIYQNVAGTIISAGDSDIVMLEDCTGMTKMQMLERENHYQKITPFCVNLNHAKYEKHYCSVCNIHVHKRRQHERSQRHLAATT